jgi:hypothetical protein
MIKSIISMFVAGYLYNRQYSEDSNVSTYGSWLLRYASNLLNMVQSGEIDLADADALLNAWQYPQFWPTDVATDLADPKLGGDVNDPAGAPRAFSMGQIF